MTYYDRAGGTATDGTPIYASVEDRYNQAEVADLLARAWKCEVRLFGPLSPIDYYALRDGRLVAVVEMKGRSHAAGRYPTVFLNVRKWLALQLAATGLGVPALFVVRFTDGVRWCRIGDVDATAVTVAGCVTRVKASSDIEPVIHVPVARMRPLP